MANAKMRRLNRSSSLPNYFAALDFGNKKTACLIAQNTGGDPEIIGGAIQQSRGINDGAVTDMARLERTIRIVVERAENIAEQRIQSVVLGIAGPLLKSETHTSQMHIGGRTITAQDMATLSETAQKKLNLGRNVLLTNFCTGYVIDDQTRVSDPIGMMAETLEARFGAISAPKTMVQNLIECCRRAGLRTISLLPASIASGTGTLSSEEQEEGAVSVDIGALSTSLALFHNNVPVWQGSVPIGGEHISRDLAHGLGTTLAAAERLKTIHGKAVSNPDDKTQIEIATLGPVGRLEPKMILRSELDLYICPRVTELVDLLRRLLFSALQEQAWLPIRVVLTGGGSQLAGLDQFVQSRLNLPTRIGIPDTIASLGASFENPHIARAAGLVRLTTLSEVVINASGASKSKKKAQFVSKCWAWLKENV